MKKALIIWGGWDGHEPQKVAARFKGLLEGKGFEVNVLDDLNVLIDEDYLKSLDIIIPTITMSKNYPSFMNIPKTAAGSGFATWPPFFKHQDLPEPVLI